LNKPEPVETDDLLSGGQPSKKKHSSWLLALSFILAAILLVLALRNVEWAAFWNSVVRGHYEFLLLTVPIASINFFIRAIRWSIFLGSEKKLPILSVFWANMLGYLGNSFLPARAGELLRSAFLGQKSGLGTSFVLATALAERILDAAALVLIGSASLLALGITSPALAGAVRIMAVASLVLLAIIIIAPFQETFILKLMGRLPFPRRILQQFSGQIIRFLGGMRCLQNGRKLVAFLFLTVIIWLIDGVGTMIGVRIVSQVLNLGQALILLSALGLSSAIPSTPGYVGVYQFVAVTVLVPFGFSPSQALAYILISQVLGYLLTGFWGLLGLWQLNRSGNLRAANP
jgi:glycosyltransferase 2 family protein